MPLQISITCPRVRGYIMLLYDTDTREMSSAPREITRLMGSGHVGVWMREEDDWVACPAEVSLSITEAEDALEVQMSYGAFASKDEFVLAEKLATTVEHSPASTFKEESSSIDTFQSKLESSIYKLNANAQQLASTGLQTLWNNVKGFFTSRKDEEKERLENLPWRLFLITVPRDALVSFNLRSTVPMFFSTVPYSYA